MREKIYEAIKTNIVQTYNGVDYKIASENATDEVLAIVQENMKGILVLVEKMIDYVEEKGKLNEEQTKVITKGIKHLERIVDTICQ